MLRGSHADFLLIAVAIVALTAPGIPDCSAAPAAEERVAQSDEAGVSEPGINMPRLLLPGPSGSLAATQDEDDGAAVADPDASTDPGLPADPVVSPDPAVSPDPGGPSDVPGYSDTIEDPGSPAIEVGELGSVSPDSGGTLEESMGGLGIDMWSGTPRSTIIRLLPQMPERHSSPALQDLARRLLLSAAVAPTRKPGDPETSLMGLRVERLEAMGLTGAVVDMIALAPDRETDPYLLRAAIDNRLLLGNVEDACEEAAGPSDALPRLYWEQVIVFCQAHSGNTAGAAFGANVLAEDGQVQDPAFFALADALIGGRQARIESLADPTPLHLAMARAANVALPSDALETDSPLILRALADSPVVTPGVRLEAAERAAMAGAIGQHRLAERYAALEFGADDLANAISRADGKRTAVERALLYQAARLHEVPAARAAAVRKALEVGAQDGMYLLTARVHRSLLEEFEPSAELAWFGADAARALYVLGRPDLADLWVETVRRFGEKPEHKRAAELLWPLARLADEVPGWRDAGHDRWIAALQESTGATWTQRAGLAYALLEAFGEPVPDENWSMLMNGASRTDTLAVDPAYLRSFRLAAADDRRGETALLAILLLGPSGVKDAGSVVVAAIIEGLTTVGLASDARRLAVEAALEGGL